MVILDTNILIAILAGHPKTNQHLASWIKESSLGLSIVSLTEVLTGQTPKKRETILKAFFDMHLLPFGQQEEAVLASQYRNQFGLKTPDAIIASTCETGGHELYTYDRDFLKLGKRWIHVLDYV